MRPPISLKVSVHPSRTFPHFSWKTAPLDTEYQRKVARAITNAPMAASATAAATTTHTAATTAATALPLAG